MPIIKSAIKRDKQIQVRRSRNLVVKHAIKSDVKVVHEALVSGDAKKTAEAFRAVVSQIDRAVKKGTLHPNTAARKKARLNAVIKTTLATKVEPTKAAKTKTAKATKSSKAKS
jgi:small subunit ribosomal protein S20